MPETTKLSCYLIGGQSLLIRCADALLERDHQIHGIISSDPSVREWSESQNIPVIEPQSDLVTDLSKHPFDYLFSIANFRIIPDELLSLPERGSVNFHDGPLPNYAGLNTPTWALINEEREHAINWHEITSGIDKGNILESRTFPIDDDEIAFTLNAKCFDHGVNGFADLLDALASGTHSPKKQELGGYRYFSKNARPGAATSIDWTESAESISALVRSLDYGPYWTPIGFAKFATRHGVYVVRRVEITDSKSALPPGTIVDAQEQLLVSTSTNDLIISSLTDVLGEEVSGPVALLEAGLGQGEAIHTISDEIANELSELDKRCCSYEPRWRQHLDQLEPLELPYASLGSAQSRPEKGLALSEFAIPDQVVEYFDSDTAAEYLFGAILIYFSQVSDRSKFDVALWEAESRISEFAQAYFQTQVPFKAEIYGEQAAGDLLDQLAGQLVQTLGEALFPRDLLLRDPGLAAKAAQSTPDLLPVALVRMKDDSRPSGIGTRDLTIAVSDGPLRCQWYFNPEIIDSLSITKMQAQLGAMLIDLVSRPTSPIGTLQILTQAERKLLLEDYAGPTVQFDAAACVHDLIEGVAAKSPSATALTIGNKSISYRELNEEANRIAHYLISTGAKPDALVGVLMDRSSQMLIAMLGVLKSGAAYLPLDPDYPADRVHYMIDNGKVHAVISQHTHTRFTASLDVPVLLLDSSDNVLDDQPTTNPSTDVCSSNIAYTIYTSGSTGKPKGVMVEHRNVVNFFTGMDNNVVAEDRKNWLAVTSNAFDISVLELLWTLARGYNVTIAGATDVEADDTGNERRKIGFSLFYFASDPGGVGRAKYDLVLKGAQFADTHGFDAIWTPERHFHAFGGLYPNPSIIGAAVAAITKNIGIRAGSVVLPLHHPLRVVEEWSVVDNLCNGRVGLSVASGWQPNDFVLAPDRYETRRESLYDDVETVRSLWRGEALSLKNPKGDMVDIKTLPRPVQSEVPIWVTAAGSADTFKKAGEIGANLLTHLLGQTVEEVREKIAIYRKAWRDNGHGPEGGHVSLMLHTMIGVDNDEVRDKVREPMKNYLRSAASLVAQYADSWAAYKQGSTEIQEKDFKDLTDDEMESLLDFSFERYFDNNALFGTVEKCAALVETVHDIGVDEIACLIDFGVDSKAVLDSLPHLNSLKVQANRRAIARKLSISDLILEHDISHVQCTPSGARTILSEEHFSEALGKLDQMLVGGEAFPPDLWESLSDQVNGEVINMYGPTETTIWSTTSKLKKDSPIVPIGKPIANTQCYVLDSANRLAPPGIAGELYIAGDGVTRGYFGRPTLTDERFVDDSVSGLEQRKLYRTGDIARWDEFGDLHFLGRIDHQVKIRGFRIELGEIETRLLENDNIEQAVVVAHSDSDGTQQLVAYCKASSETALVTESVVAHLAKKLPDYMIPSQILVLDRFPLTPNKKIDRNALPDPAEVFKARSISESTTGPSSELEEQIRKVWEDVLGLSPISLTDNFFDIGGHSLRAVQVQGQLRTLLDMNVPITDLFRFPTIRSFAANIMAPSTDASDKAIDRAKQRRAARGRRKSRATKG